MADSAYYWNKKIADKFLYDCDNIVKQAECYNHNELYDSTLVYTSLYNRTVDSTNISVNRERAYAYYKNKNYKRCAYHLEQALLFKPNFYTTIFKIAQAYGLIKDYANEKKYYQMFLANVANIGKPDDHILGLCKMADTRIAEIGKIKVK